MCVKLSSVVTWGVVLTSEHIDARRSYTFLILFSEFPSERDAKGSVFGCVGEIFKDI